ALHCHLAEGDAGKRARAHAGIRVLARRRRGELDEDARGALRVEEADEAGETRPRRLIDHRQPRATGGGELGRDVGRLEADVVESLPAPGEELGDAARVVDGLEQLDLTPADRQQRGPHTLILNRRLLGDAEPEDALPEGEAVLEAADDQADVVNASEHLRGRIAGPVPGPSPPAA